MIPQDKDQQHDTNDTKPKAFNFGYFFGETAELIYEGWRQANANSREYHRLEKAREDRKHIQELLEVALYDSASRGTPEQQIEALYYLQRKKEAEQHAEQRLYTWGEQLSSLALNTAFLSALAVVFSFTAQWSCGRNQSEFCQDIRATTGGVVRYFAAPKPIESELLK